MKAKRFFTHTGLALGYLAFFFIVQFWCTGLYGFGAGISIGLAAPSDPVAATEILSTRLLEQMDIILLDPPYGMDMLPECFDLISEYDLLAENGLIIAEHRKEEQLPEELGKYSKIKERKYGTVVISIYG